MPCEMCHKSMIRRSRRGGLFLPLFGVGTGESEPERDVSDIARRPGENARLDEPVTLPGAEATPACRCGVLGP